MAKWTSQDLWVAELEFLCFFLLGPCFFLGVEVMTEKNEDGTKQTKWPHSKLFAVGHFSGSGQAGSGWKRTYENISSGCEA